MSNRPVVAVLDYGIGNLRSAQKALEHVGADARLSADPTLIGDAAAVVLPGVGAFGRCAEALAETGLDGVAAEAAEEASQGGRPFLGICVGLQLLHEGSQEAPDRPGLGVLPGRVDLLAGNVKRPQMQWNRLDGDPDHPMLSGVGGNPWVYFVHSYVAPVGEDTLATCDYGGPMCAALARGRLWATQFHPEKSGRPGLTILENFLRGLEDAQV